MVEQNFQNVGGMQLVGALEVKQLLDAYPRLVARAAVRKGLKAGGTYLVEKLQTAAPAKTGTLRSAMRIGSGKTRNPANFRIKVGLGPIKGDNIEKAMARYEASVRLAKAFGRRTKAKKPRAKTRFYYKTLEFGRKGGPPLRPFFMDAYRSARNTVAQLIVDGTRDALYAEAARIHSRTLRLKKRR